MHDVLANAVRTHHWVGVYPSLHQFCANDLSAFYFDIRKDVIYCDAAASPRRSAARTVLDILHRALSTWLAPVLVFTAEEAWAARFGSKESVHLQNFFKPDASWYDEKLGACWSKLRGLRRVITSELEVARRDGLIRSSLEARVNLPLTPQEDAVFGEVDWSELAIVSEVEIMIQMNAAPIYLDATDERLFLMV